MAWLQLSQFNMPKSDIIDNLSLLEEFIYEPTSKQPVQLKCKVLFNHIVNLLSMFKNKAAWQYIVIDYCYAFDNQRSPSTTALIVLKNGFAKRLNECVINLIHSYNMRLIGKVCSLDGVIYDACQMRGLIVINKISIFKFKRKRNRRVKTYEFIG